MKLITNNSDDYDEKYMKNKFNLHNGLPLTKTLELYKTITVLRSIFHKGSKNFFRSMFL